MESDDILIFKTLKWLARKADDEGIEFKDQKFQTVRSGLEAQNRLTNAYLENLEKKLLEGELTWDPFVGKCFLLPCPIKGNKFVPTLYISFGGLNSGFTTGHYLFGEGVNENTSFGIRYEEPHSGNTDEASDVGMHDYYHAQFVNSVRDTSIWFHTYLPDSAPAFPLHASDRLELFFSCLMSIYGKKLFIRYMSEIRRDQVVLQDQPENTMLVQKMKTWAPAN